MSKSSEQFLDFREAKFIDLRNPEVKEQYFQYLKEIDEGRNPEDTVLISFKGELPAIKSHNRPYFEPNKHSDTRLGYDYVTVKIKNIAKAVKELEEQGYKIIDYYY